MRHGKSSWNLPCSDFERPLKKRGQHEASAMGKHLVSLNILPQFVQCSSAKRTMETFEYLCSGWNHEFDIEFIEELYHAPSDTLIEHSQLCPEKYHSQIIIAHNPGMTDIQSELEINEHPHMPTSACILIELQNTPWKSWNKSHIHRAQILKPSELFE